MNWGGGDGEELMEGWDWKHSLPLGVRDGWRENSLTPFSLLTEIENRDSVTYGWGIKTPANSLPFPGGPVTLHCELRKGEPLSSWVQSRVPRVEFFVTWS